MIQVLPDPVLTVRYFRQRFVEADDPFTPVVEPSVAGRDSKGCLFEPELYRYRDFLKLQSKITIHLISLFLP